MTLQEAILQIQLRADKWDDDSLVKTFVNVGPLIPLLNSDNNQILYGRRGTGKTHIFRYLKAKKETDKECGIFIDLRKIGSSHSIYSNENIPIAQKGLRLFIDIIQNICNDIINYITQDDERKELYLHKVTPFVESLKTTWSKEFIQGNIRTEQKQISNITDTDNFDISIGNKNSFSLSSQISSTSGLEKFVKQEGIYSSYINLSEASRILQHISDTITPHRIWIFFDEYSELPIQLQVILSDIIRHIICPVRGIVFKIAGIAHRSMFRQINDDKITYTGLELGADVNTINLDELMVFGNNKASSLMFFRDLLFLRLNAILPESDKIANSDELVHKLFTQEKCFEELVVAAEGVPRDFFNILNKSVLSDYYNAISIPNIRKASKNWYSEDKHGSIMATENAKELLSWIISTVIGKRQARAFMLKSDTKDPLINLLFDARILHLIKQNISAQDIPGARYDVYSIDYGCYVDLITTSRAPKGLFEEELEDGSPSFVEVPRDDYRSIRRAILDMSEFYTEVSRNNV